MFIFFLILIILLASAGMYYYLAQKLDSQRKQLLVLSKQNDVLRDKFSKHKKGSVEFKELTVRYSIPAFKEGITIEKSSLYIAPYTESPLLMYMEKAINVSIIIKAELLNTTWYEVYLHTNSSINCRGWIKANEVKPVNT